MNTTPHSPGGSAAQHKSSPQDHLQTLQEDAQSAIASAKEQGSAQFEQYRDTAADQIETLAQGAQSAAEQLQDGDTLGLSHYVTDIAQNMTALAGNLRGKSIDELLHQAGKLARENPALFVTGSVALGFGLSRFLKASSSNTEQGSGPSSTGSDAGWSRQNQTESGSGMQSDPDSPESQPHVGDVHHSSRPGVVDRSATPDVVSASPLSGTAGGPLEGDLPAGSPRRDDLSGGDI